MTTTEPLRSLADYERALNEIAEYFNNQPEPGTEAADRFDRLTALVMEYEDANFPIPEERANAAAEGNVQGTREELISRFEEGLMLASDKEYILALLQSPAATVDCWKDQASKKDAELTVLRDQVASLSPEMPLYAEAAAVCAELYQVIAHLAEELGVFAHPDVQRALDNASAHRLVHRNLLPWPRQPLQPTGGSE